MRSALLTFLDGSRDEHALHDLVVVLATQFDALRPALVTLMSHPDLLRPELEEVWRADADLLRGYVDPSASDAADWVMRAWTAFMDFSLSVMNAIGSALSTIPLVSNEAATYEPGSPLRAQVLMMAAIESIRRKDTPESVADLIFRAFDEVVRLLQELQRVGVTLDPYRGETLTERAERTARYADHLRGALNNSDMRELDDARLLRLR
jgi:hypothetical protein